MVGTHSITVSWQDNTTGRTVTSTFNIIVLTERDYNIKVMTGEISEETAAPVVPAAGGAPGGGGGGFSCPDAG